jgi:hypothetical protein
MTTEKRSKGANSITCRRKVSWLGRSTEETDFIIVAMVENDIDSFYDVGVLEGGANTELCGDLFLVLLFALACAAWTKLLYGVYVAAVLSLDETNSATCTAAEYLAPLSVLF